jgi:hypothetical protein
MGWIPGGITGIFIDFPASDRTMALPSTQPFLKMSTRIIPCTGGRCLKLTTSLTLRAVYHGIWEAKAPTFYKHSKSPHLDVLRVSNGPKASCTGIVMSIVYVIGNKKTKSSMGFIGLEELAATTFMI